MKVEGYLFIGCAVFFAGADIVYWYFSHDPTGTTALALAVGLAFLTGFYILFTGLNEFSSISSFVLGASLLPFFYNVYITAKKGKRVEVDDPWGYGQSLEWATSCPPPRHNFTSIPRIRSERPAFDLHHPESGAFARPAAELEA